MSVQISKERALLILKDLEDNQRCICEQFHGVNFLLEILTEAGHKAEVDKFKLWFKNNVRKQKFKRRPWMKLNKEEDQLMLDEEIQDLKWELVSLDERQETDPTEDYELERQVLLQALETAEKRLHEILFTPIFKINP